MPTISGPLTVVTEDAAVVTGVWVQAPALRPHGEGAILPQRARATISTGAVVSFSCAPGPAVLIWQAGGVEDQVPILVDDAPSQTLAEVVGAAQLASGRTQDELAALVAQVVRDAAAAGAAAGVAESARDTAVSARDEAVTARDEAVPAAGVATGARDTTLTARDAAVTARDQAEGFKAQAATSAQAAADDAASAQLAEDGAGTARDQAQALVSQANQALDQALAVIADAESLQDVVTALENVDAKISAAIAALVGAAPEHLDTLEELAAAVEGLDPALRDLIAERLALEDVAVEVVASKVVRRSSTGDVLVPASPSGASSAVARDWVQAQLTAGLAGKANVSHTHDIDQITVEGGTLELLLRTWTHRVFDLNTRLDTIESRVDTRKGVIHSGTGGPPSSIPGAMVGDWWLDESTMELHKIEGV